MTVSFFEAFGYEFLAAVLGYDFIPTGGTKDRGVDGFYLSYLALYVVSV